MAPCQHDLRSAGDMASDYKALDLLYLGSKGAIPVLDAADGSRTTRLSALRLRAALDEPLDPDREGESGNHARAQEFGASEASCRSWAGGECSPQRKAVKPCEQAGNPVAIWETPHRHFQAVEEARLLLRLSSSPTTQEVNQLTHYRTASLSEWRTESSQQEKRTGRGINASGCSRGRHPWNLPRFLGSVVPSRVHFLTAYF